MSKNNNQCFLGSNTIGYSDYKIRQMMSLPENTTVMVVDTDKNDEVVMRDCIETSGAYCLVLVEDASGETMIYPYNLGSNGGLDVRGTVVPVRHCPKCGKRMRMTMEECDEATLIYGCMNCGHHETAWTEVEENDYE